MAPGSVARIRAIALLRRATLLVLFLLSVGLIPGAVRAADPRNMDVLPAPAAGRIGGPAGPVAAIPPGSAVATESPRVFFCSPRTDQVVALTFHDGYAPANVRQIFEEGRRAATLTDKRPATLSPGSSGRIAAFRTLGSRFPGLFHNQQMR